jgi:hypothetical protein
MTQVSLMYYGWGLFHSRTQQVHQKHNELERVNDYSIK